jgi:hypothetical protein
MLLRSSCMSATCRRTRTRVPPKGTNEAENDPVVALIELFSYVADRLSDYQDQVADESWLRSRRFAISMLALVAILFWWRRRRPDDR